MHYYSTVPSWNVPLRNTAANKMLVNGSGKVNVKPDIAIVSIGVVTESEDVKQAQQENAAITNQVIQALQQAGIKEEDIETTTYTVRRKTDYVNGMSVFRGYEVRHVLSITVRNIEQAGSILDLAIQNGANEQYGIQFNVSNEAYYYQQALQLAIQDGLAKAKAMAKTLNVTIVEVPIKLTETSRMTPDRVQPFLATAKEQATPIQAGLYEINATVDMQLQYY